MTPTAHMTTAPFGFPCPSCGALIRSPSGEAGRQLECSVCGAASPAPRPQASDGRPSGVGSGHEAPGRRPLKQTFMVGVASLLGTGFGWWVFGGSPLILIGSLLGFLTGRTVFGIIAPEAEERSGPAWIPQAHLAVGLSVGGWLLAFGLGLLSNEMLRGEGASLLMLLFLPGVGVCGLLGGPTASTMARRGLRQIESGQRPESDRRWAWWALVLGRAMTVTVLIFLLSMLVRLFG